MNAVTMMRQLEEGGVPPGQAKAIAETFCQQVEETLPTKDFVEFVVNREVNGLRSEMHGLRSEMHALHSQTQNDINGLRAEVQKDINGLRADMMREIHELGRESDHKHREMMKWWAGIAIIQTGTIMLGAAGIAKFVAG